MQRLSGNANRLIMMLATPVRWFLMLCVAACGYFMISSSDTAIRAASFIGSVVCWQAYYVIMIWEADAIRSSGMKKRQGAACPSCQANFGLLSDATSSAASAPSLAQADALV